jgi:hypothetical protein
VRSAGTHACARTSDRNSQTAPSMHALVASECAGQGAGTADADADADRLRRRCTRLKSTLIAVESFISACDTSRATATDSPPSTLASDVAENDTNAVKELAFCSTIDGAFDGFGPSSTRGSPRGVSVRRASTVIGLLGLLTSG